MNRRDAAFRSRWWGQAFTLIELLVVIAKIYTHVTRDKPDFQRGSTWTFVYNDP
jgi:hypothetical protein